MINVMGLLRTKLKPGLFGSVLFICVCICTYVHRCECGHVCHQRITLVIYPDHPCCWRQVLLFTAVYTTSGAHGKSKDCFVSTSHLPIGALGIWLLHRLWKFELRSLHLYDRCFYKLSHLSGTARSGSH